MDQVGAMIFLTVMGVLVMVGIAVFLLRVNKQVQRRQAEELFGDISHVKIPDDPRDLAKARKPKPPYRPL